MIGPDSLPPDLRRPPRVRLGLLVVPARVLEPSEVVVDARDVVVDLADGPDVDVESPPVKRLRLVEGPCVLEDDGEIVERIRGLERVRAEGLLGQLDRRAQDSLGVGVSAARPVEAAQRRVRSGPDAIPFQSGGSVLASEKAR
jgi:hypothetical protein